MPRENRKRGKKHKKSTENTEPEPEQEPTFFNSANNTSEYDERPSWIVSRPAEDSAELNIEAPFGYVDADVKAYFRTIDDQLREWQQSTEDGTQEEAADVDPNEARKMFFVAALNEMADKEKQLATDPDCSLIMERMSYSMDDFARRVLVDRLTGSYEMLIKHRFASHVCQTLFMVAGNTVSRENQGLAPAANISSDEGELRTMTQLTLDICEELLPSLPTLLLDPFASHVIRAILLLLAPTLPSAQDSSTLRSKKSANWKKKQGSIKSIFSSDLESITRRVPTSFKACLRRWIKEVQKNLDENEVRAMAASKVGSPVLKVLLEAEAHLDMHSHPGSLMDRVSVGLITAFSEGNTETVEASDYLLTLLRDPTSSHLLEALISLVPENIFHLIWTVYIQPTLSRLTIHPVANFVVAKALERAPKAILEDMAERMDEDGGWGKVVRANRVGVLKAFVERTAALHSYESQAVNAARAGFGFNEEGADSISFVPAVLVLMSAHYYQENQKTQNQKAPEPNVQGAVLLQSLLKLSSPHNAIVIDSLTGLHIEELIKLAHHPISSRVIDVFLDTPSVPVKSKRQLIMSLLGHFHTLVDDRIGSRVGDRIWATADTYLKEKIAKSMMSQENFLAASFYGKFFAKSLNLYLLRKRPDEWRTWQAERTKALAPATTTQETKIYPEPQPTEQETGDNDKTGKKRKRADEKPKDEIDVLFGAALGKKVKKGALAKEGAKKEKKQAEGLDAGLMDAIRAAPGAQGSAKKHKKK